MSSIFTRIIRGEIPCYKIHEDEHTISILAREQIQLGHTLVIPKMEVDKFYDVPEPQYSAMFRNAKTLAKSIAAATGCVRVGSAIVGLEVPHCHLHLIPLFEMSDMDFRKAKMRKPEEMEAIRDKIVRNMAT